MTTPSQPEVKVTEADRKVARHLRDVCMWPSEANFASVGEAWSQLIASHRQQAVAAEVEKAVTEAIQENDEDHRLHQDLCQKEMDKALVVIRSTPDWPQSTFPSSHDRVWVAAAIKIAVAAETAGLRAENERLKQQFELAETSGLKLLASLQRRLTEAEAKLAAAAKDTERLDWLLTKSRMSTPFIRNIGLLTDPYSAIDACLLSSSPAEKEGM